MSRPQKPHASLWLYAENPVVMVGDLIRLRRETQWMDGRGAQLFVAAGTLGEVRCWGDDDSPGVAIAFQGFSHPKFSLFPMSQHKPGMSRYSDAFELVTRKTAHDVEEPDYYPALPHRRLQEPEEEPTADVPRLLAPDADPSAASGDPRSAQGIRQPSAQKGGARSRGQRPRTARH